MKLLEKRLQLSLLLLALMYLPSVQANITDGLQIVGEARLKVWLWKVYDSSLYSESGYYQGIEPNLTLQIDYLRNRYFVFGAVEFYCRLLG